LTASRFVPDPFSEHAGARLYRSGDLARWRRDGTLEFVGRVDQQVKIRGYRVELEEIEAVLSTHAGVREQVVVVREDVIGDKRLVAYIVKEAGCEVEVQDLRTLVQGRLPEYMHPAHYVFLTELPVTLNRKVDRRRLPAPEIERVGSEESYVAPGTEMEAEIARIWQEVLRVERVGVLDNFFELGGHSLLVTQVVSRLRTRYGIDLPVRLFFGKVTIRQIAAEIEQIRATSVSSSRQTIKRATRQRVNVQVSAYGELVPQVQPAQ
jgi:acyl carrier protein